MVIRISLFVVVLSVIPGWSTAALAAPACPAHVFFGNGINTDRDDAQLDLENLLTHLNNALDHDSRPGLDVSCVEVAYATDIGKLVGVIESAEQIIDNDFTLFWQTLTGLVSSSDILQGAMQAAFSTASDIEATNPDLQEQLVNYAQTLFITSVRAVVVAHSQGNLFANSAYSALSAGFSSFPPIAADMFSIVSVATPQAFVAGGGPHTTLYGDIILASPTALPANTRVEGSKCRPFEILGVPFNQIPGHDAFECHSFSDSYLAGTFSEPQIMADVIARLPLTLAPTARDDAYSMAQGTTLMVQAPGVVSNDTIPSGLQSVDFLNIPAGSFTNTGGGGFSFAPNSNVSGAIAFSYIIHSTSGDSNVATVTVEVIPAPVPIAHNDSYIMAQGTTLTVPAPGVLTNDTYPPGSTIEFLPPFPPATLTNVAPNTGGFVLDLHPNPTFTGTMTVQYIIHSTSGDSNVATVTVLVQVNPSSSVIFSDYGPNNSVCATCNWWDTGAHLPEQPYYRGMAFTVPAGAGFTLDAVSLTVFDSGVQFFGFGPAALVVSINADSQGVPGGVLEQFTVTNFSGSTYASPVLVTANSVLHPTLTGGARYWVTTAVTSPTTMQAGWIQNSQGSTGLTAWHAGASPWSLPWGTTPQPLAAFSVSGTPVKVLFPSLGQTIDDDFSDDSINTSLWSVAVVPAGAGTITETNQHLEMVKLTAGDQYLGLQGKCKVRGDFDVQVDFTLLNWPTPQNFHTVRLSADGLPPGPFGVVGVYRNSYGDENFQLRAIGGVVASVSAADFSGKLRLKRTGAVIEGYYWNGTAFVLIGSSPTTTDDTRLVIDFVGTTGAPITPPAGVAIAFDNFKAAFEALGSCQP